MAAYRRHRPTRVVEGVEVERLTFDELLGQLRYFTRGACLVGDVDEERWQAAFGNALYYLLLLKDMNDTLEDAIARWDEAWTEFDG